MARGKHGKSTAAQHQATLDACLRRWCCCCARAAPKPVSECPFHADCCPGCSRVGVPEPPPSKPRPLSCLPAVSLQRFPWPVSVYKRGMDHWRTEGMCHTSFLKAPCTLLLITGGKAFRSCTLCKKSEEFIKMQYRLKCYLENRYLGKHSCCQYRNK